MPRGFIGQPATKYLTQAKDAHTKSTDKATQTNNQVSANAPRSANTASRMRIRQLPFEPAEGIGGSSVPTGRNNSSNIVVDQQEYQALTQMISQADDRLGACMYHVAQEIEALCKTVFVLPDAVPRCLNISETVKRSLGEYSSITEDRVLQTRKFAREINDIGW